ncbi:MAG TPA: radical SAM protein [Humisphaera sp.]
MADADLFPSPFVSVRSSARATAFHDRFTGQQLVLAEPAGAALAAVFRGEAAFKDFAAAHPAEAARAAGLSMVAAEPSPGPYLRAMLSSIDVEPAGSCNAVCGMCPRSEMTRPKSVMAPETFEALCGQLEASFPDVVRQVLFCGFGEPTQNPRLADMSRRVRRAAPRAVVSVISNGSLLTPELVDALVRSEVDAFSCSFQSNTKRKYESIMRGLDYDVTVAGLRALLAAARGTRLAVYINVTATDETVDEIPALVRTWEAQGARVVVNPLHNRGGFLKLEGRFTGGGVGGGPVARCGLLNSRLFVSSEGDVLSCCHDLTAETRLGNVRDEPLTDILLRRLDRIARSDLFRICGTCTDDSALSMVALPPPTATGSAATGK